MKKIIHIILAILLFTATTGMAFSTHYCSGTKVSVAFFKVAESCCGDADCCHNENSFIKVKDDFAASQISDIPQLAEIIILGIQFSDEIQINIQETPSALYQFSDSPPPLPLQTILSLKQVYLL